MNKFADLLESLKAAGPGDEAFKRLLETVDHAPMGDLDQEPELRLPYSSDPPPIGEPWAN